MWRGNLVSIYIAPATGEPTQPVSEIRAIPGRGLEGDRYFKAQGGPLDPDRQVTLVEIEAIEALQSEQGIALKPGDVRRNLVTRGVPLNHLVGKDFTVGGVTLHGVRLCEPCSYLAEKTQADVEAGLAHRGGLRAAILTEGILRVGDSISE